MNTRSYVRTLTALMATAMAVQLAPFASGATATWSEEMDAAPNANHPGRWGSFDDAQGWWLNSGPPPAVDASTAGVWRIAPNTGVDDAFFSFGGYDAGGMAAIDGPRPATPSPTAEFNDFTVEVRYRINTTLSGPEGGNPGQPIVMPTEEIGSFTAFPFAIDVSSGTTPGLKYKEGYRSQDGVTNGDGYSYFEVQSNEVGQSQYKHPSPVDFPQPARDEWHTLRITQSFSGPLGGSGALDQKVYLNGSLLVEFIRPNTFVQGNRGIWIRQEGSGWNAMGGYEFDGAEMTLQELLLDYIRVVEGVVPIGEALNAPGGVTFDAADFDQDGDVDTVDFNAWRTNFGAASGSSKAQGDADGDGDVDGTDFLSWQAQYGKGGGSFGAAPEPMSIVSLALASGLLCARRRR